MAIKVGINGYGTIGKRVADAVTCQDDMKIVGVTKRSPSFEAFDAVKKGFPLFAAEESSKKRLSNAGLEVSGILDDMVEDCDVIVDCTPKNAGYKPYYQKKGVKAIWQGGEKHQDIGSSFNAYTNYDGNLGKDYVRVVSCNTTGLARTLYPLKNFGLKDVFAVMVRRSADPWDSKRGPINSIEPVLDVPSHHGPDLKTVMDVDIETTAVKVPTTIMHLHSLVCNFDSAPDRDAVLSEWEKLDRIKLFSSEQGIKGTAQVMEMSRDMGRPRSDLFEIGVWSDGTHVKGNKLYFYQAIHQESDVVPDNVDCIRAMMESASQWDSIKKTDRGLGIS